MNEKVKSVLNSVLERFEIGDIPEAIAYSMFPFPDVPSAKWSLLSACTKVLNEVERVLNLILNGNTNENKSIEKLVA